MVGILVLPEGHDLNQRDVIDDIPGDQTAPVELVEKWRNFDRIEREKVAFDALWTILEPAFSVGQHGQKCERQAGPNGALRKVFVPAETGLYVACASHLENLGFALLLRPLECLALRCSARGRALRCALAAIRGTRPPLRHMPMLAGDAGEVSRAAD